MATRRTVHSSRVRWLLAYGVVLGLGCSSRMHESVQSSVETAVDGIVHIENRLLDVPETPRVDDSFDMAKSYVDIGGGTKLYVLEEGSGPPLVLVNGGPGNTLHSFLPHFSDAAPFSRVIYYDHRGTGLSDWEPGADGYSTSQTVDDLDALRHALGIDRWFVLGHSYGGLIAQWYAIRYPENMLGMVLVGSSVPVDGLDLGERDYRSDAERKRIREIYAVNGQTVVPVHSDRVDLATLQRMIYNGIVNGDWKRQYFFRPSRERMAQIARYEWVHDRDFNRQMRDDGFARDLGDLFVDFPVSTLIVEGAYDANWGPEKPALLAKEHPNACLVVLDRAAHFPFAERPQEFFTTLEEFVRGAETVSVESIISWKESVADR